MLGRCFAYLLIGSIAFSSLAYARVQIKVDDQPGDQIVLQCRPGDVTTDWVRIGQDRYARITLGDESVSKIVGVPALPTICRSVIIPDDAEMVVGVESSEFYEITDVDVAPSRGYIRRSISPDRVPYTFGAAYEKDAFWPEQVATLRPPYILRDHRGAVLVLHPVQYNPVARVLRIYTKITVAIKASGPGKVNVRRPRTPARPTCRAFEDLYAAHFVNYEAAAGQRALSEFGDLLIIGHDDWLAPLHTLADHKTALGIDTTVVGMSAVGGGDAASIKSYIQSVYDAGDLSFVLLVGDAAQVPAPYSSGGGAADPTYALLEGDDGYPDIMVGRFSAEQIEDVQTQVQRTMEYELVIPGSQTWRQDAMGIGSDEDEGILEELDHEHIEEIRLRLLDGGYTSVDQIYDPGASQYTISDGLNAGRGLINYCGHGGYGGWNTGSFSNADVEALTNVSKLPVIISCACNVGRFDIYTCFGETWLRATSAGQPVGAVAIYASSVGQFWDPPKTAQDEINDLLIAGTYGTFGTLCFTGACKMMDDWPGPGTLPTGGGEEMFQTWIVFGDPSLRAFDASGMVTLPSGGYDIVAEPGGPFEPASMDYMIANNEDIPLDYQITTDADWLDISSTTGTIAPGNQTTVTVSPGSSAALLGHGAYTGHINIINTTNHVGDTTRTVKLTVLTRRAIASFTLNTDPGWSRTGSWAFGQPTGSGGTTNGNPDPTTGATGNNVFGVNLHGDYSLEPGGPYHLTTGAINCAGHSDVELRFQRWLNTDYAPYVTSTIDISTDATAWTSVWSWDTMSELADAGWIEQSLDLSALADDQPEVYMRWSYTIGEDAFAYSGWNIDDIDVWGTIEQRPPDIDGNGTVDLADFAILQGCMAGPGLGVDATCILADLDVDADVDMTDFRLFERQLGN